MLLTNSFHLCRWFVNDTDYMVESVFNNLSIGGEFRIPVMCISNGPAFPLELSGKYTDVLENKTLQFSFVNRTVLTLKFEGNPGNVTIEQTVKYGSVNPRKVEIDFFTKFVENLSHYVSVAGSY